MNAAKVLVTGFTWFVGVALLRRLAVDSGLKGLVAVVRRKAESRKISEYAATGWPVLAGIAANPTRDVELHERGVEVFASCDAAVMVKALGRLLDGPRLVDRADFRGRFSRRRIMHDMAVDVLRTAEPKT